MTALELFRQGNDYLTIASKLDISEAEVEREIHRLRNTEIAEKEKKRKRLEQQRDHQRRTRAANKTIREMCA